MFLRSLFAHNKENPEITTLMDEVMHSATKLVQKSFDKATQKKVEEQKKKEQKIEIYLLEDATLKTSTQVTGVTFNKKFDPNSMKKDYRALLNRHNPFILVNCGDKSKHVDKINTLKGYLLAELTSYPVEVHSVIYTVRLGTQTADNSGKSKMLHKTTKSSALFKL